MGGKNAIIVSRKADLDKAAMGVMRSAFGLTGQKCSACSRVYVEEPVHEAFVQKLVELTNKIAVGDPSRQEIYMGPAANKGAYRDYQNFVEALHRDGKVVAGGKILTDGDYGMGFFVAPTVVDELPLDHELWKVEMFLPIVKVAGVESLEQAMALANDSVYGLTSGFFSEDRDEAQWYPGQHRGRRRLRQPAGRRDHRGVARLPGFRRLEGQRQHRQSRRQLLLRPAVHARAVADGDRLIRLGSPTPTRTRLFPLSEEYEYERTPRYVRKSLSLSESDNGVPDDHPVPRFPFQTHPTRWGRRAITFILCLVSCY